MTITQAADPAIPIYLPTGSEREVFESAYRTHLPILIKGPTGCGKTRFVRHMAARLQRPLITVACHDDLTAGDLVGRYLVKGGETVWCDGPLTRAVREGAILYLDELVEARADTTVVIHPLTDDRRILPVDKRDELLTAPPEFMLVVSYNPGYQQVMKELKPSTRQRFVALEFDYPTPAVEQEILVLETSIDQRRAERLVTLAGRIRALKDRGLAETVSTRSLIYAATLMRSGIADHLACQVALVGPLTDDVDIAGALTELVALLL
jgi:nitric oxide reductase NorQ protein